MSKSTDELLRELESGGVLEGGKQIATRPQPAKQSTSRGRGIGTRLTDSTVALAIGAIILISIIGSLPVLSLALYPFSLFVTLLHETGHALAATITGGVVDSIQVASDLSGLTTTSGGTEELIAPAGYLGATVAGAAILLTPTRYSRWVLGSLALVPLAAVTVFHAADTFTTAWSVLFAVTLLLSAWKLPPRWRGFLQIFLGVEAGLNAFRDLMTLVFIEGSNAHIQTDADNMSHALFGPPIFWAVTWTVLSMAILALTLLVLLRREMPGLRLRKRSPGSD